MDKPANQNTDDLEYSPQEILRARRIVLDSVPTEWMDFLDWQYRSEHLVEHPHQSYDLAWGLVREGLVQIVSRPVSTSVMLDSIRRVPAGFDMSGIRHRFETRTLTDDDRRAIRDEAERDITDAHLMMVDQYNPGQSRWREMQRRIKRTRRAHVCARSGVPIPPGERHLRLSYGIGHEQMLTQRVCLSVAWCEANDLRRELWPGIYSYSGLKPDIAPCGPRGRGLPFAHGQAMPPR